MSFQKEFRSRLGAWPGTINIMMMLTIPLFGSGCASFERLSQPSYTQSISQPRHSTSHDIPPYPETAVAQPRPPSAVETDKLNTDPARSYPDFDDLWARIRFGFQLTELDTPVVDTFAERFARTDLLTRLAPRARRYLYLLVTEAEKRGIPTELALLPIIESGLNPNARSPANAVGLCQFIPSTGKRFGLHQSAFADRRKDIACVQGMFEYLESNSALFGGDWFLALAAYNWGEGAVTKAIERNRRNGLPTDYLSLRMPSETRAYVPQLLAIKQLIAYPERYGIQLPPLDNRPTIDCDVRIPKDIDVVRAAQFAALTPEQFREMNPGVIRPVVPRATHPTICLPVDRIERFSANLATYPGAQSSWMTLVTSRTKTVESLATHYRTTPEIIRKANGIPPGMRLRRGSTVLVPARQSENDIPLEIAATAQVLIEPEVPPMKRISVKVKRGDTLGGIARQHRVSLQSIRKWNSGVREHVRIGQILVLHVPAQHQPTIRKT